jgi:hypothetical protein
MRSASLRKTSSIDTILAAFDLSCFSEHRVSSMVYTAVVIGLCLLHLKGKTFVRASDSTASDHYRDLHCGARGDVSVIAAAYW